MLGDGIPPPIFSESAHLSCDADHKKPFFDLGSLATTAGSGDAFADGLAIRLNSSGSRALFDMNLIIAFAVAFAVGFGAGYVTRARKSRMRRRRYYRADSAD